MFVEGEGLSDIPTDLPGISVSRGGSFIGAPSPSSAVMTVSLDAYLDPQRISYGSPAEYDMVPRISSPDDTFPVFSPPPYDVNQDRESVIDQNMLVPPNSTSSGPAPTPQARRHRRLSSLNTVSWPNPNELTVSPTPKPRRMSTVASSDAGAQEVDVILERFS
jgi:hypothetical protein